MMLRILPILLLSCIIPTLAVQQCKCTDYELCMEQNDVKKTFAGCMEHCTDKHADPVNADFSTCMMKHERPLTKTIDCMYNKLGMGCAKPGLTARSQIKMQILKRNLTEFRDLVVTELETMMELKEGDFAHENENSAAVKRCLLRCFYPARNLCTYTYKCGLQFPEEPKMVKMLMDCANESGIRGRVEDSIKKCIGATLMSDDKVETEDSIFPSSASEELLELEDRDEAKAVQTTTTTTTTRVNRTRPGTTVTVEKAKVSTRPLSVGVVTTTMASTTSEASTTLESTTEEPSTTEEQSTTQQSTQTTEEQTTDSTTEQSTTINDTVVEETGATSAETTADSLESFDEQSSFLESGESADQKTGLTKDSSAQSLSEPFKKQRHRL